MRNIFLLLFFFNVASAQTSIPYANFIQTDTAVKWAAVYNSYVNLTTANPNFNIRNFYLKKIQTTAVNAYTEDSMMLSVSGYTLTENMLQQNKKAIPYDKAKMNWCFNYDNRFDAFENLFKEDSNSCEKCLTGNKLSLFKVKQLLYYKNNQLKIQNILLSPVLYNKDFLDNKEEAKYTEIANVAFNAADADAVTIPSTAVFISRACNDLILLPTPRDHTAKRSILTLDNWSLGVIFIHDLLKKKLVAYNADNSPYPSGNTILPYNKITTYHLQPIRVNIYDANGISGATAYKTIMPEINYDSIYNFRVIQDFYFDFTNEKLYSKLIAFIPLIRIITQSGIDLGLSNHWGIIFPEDKKKLPGQKK